MQIDTHTVTPPQVTRADGIKSTQTHAITSTDELYTVEYTQVYEYVCQ